MGLSAPTEADFTRQVLALARLCRWRAAHFRPGLTRSGGWATAVQGDGAGFPDLILVKPGRVVVAELKVGRNRPTPGQRAWLQAFESAGVPAYVWRPEDWPEVERVLGGCR
jgi:hypothetical protein